MALILPGPHQAWSAKSDTQLTEPPRMMGLIIESEDGRGEPTNALKPGVREDEKSQSAQAHTARPVAGAQDQN